MSESVICSARGCREVARWQLHWRNPRLHGPERRKVWTACDVHRAGLEEFLATRGFPLDVVPMPPGPAAEHA